MLSQIRWRPMKFTIARSHYFRTLIVKSNDHQTQSKLNINFEDTQKVYSSKRTYEIYRSYIVLYLCTYPHLVNNSEWLMDISNKILGRRLFEHLMRLTFFGQFVGGVDVDELKPVITRMEKAGVKALLNYSAEADIDDKLNGEESCEENLNVLLSVIECSSALSNDRNFSSFKITGLTTPSTLLIVSELLIKVRELFELNAVVDNDLDDKFLSDLPVQLVEGKPLLAHRVISKETLSELTNVSVGDISVILRGKSKLNFNTFRAMCVPGGELNTMLTRANLLTDISKHHITALSNLKKRLAKLGEHAVNLKARLMIDAEQTYLQPTIDYCAITMMEKFNKDIPYISNTYQCYLRDTPNKLIHDAAHALNHGYKIGIKQVRGAYMTQERARAIHLSYPDPLHESKKLTDDCYNTMLEVVIELLKRDVCSVMVAGHNETSIKNMLGLLERSGVDRTNVCFGQLYGMSDPITYTLGSIGYNAFKAVPYGPVVAVLPYLARRARENAGVVEGTHKELNLLGKELRRRKFGLFTSS